MKTGSGHAPKTIRTQMAYSPKSRGEFLRALGDFQTELFRVTAGFLPEISRWELRRELAELVFRDARCVQDMRVRCRELGAAPASIHLSRSVRGQSLVEVLCASPGAGAGIYAIFLIVKQCLRGLLDEYLREDLRVFDAPTVPLIEGCIAEMDRQIAWAAKQPETQADFPQKWVNQIRKKCLHLKEDLAKGGVHTGDPLRQGRKMGRLPVLRSVIPDGFREGLALRNPVMERDYDARALFHAHNFFMEVQAADSCASLLFEAPDMPWDFYFDMARHMWDETRHCEFGELKLRQLGRDIREIGISNAAYVLRQTLDPLDRYAALTTQEADAFPGKHAGLQDALAHGDELSARAWSYDIADETQHVRYGHKWIPVMKEVMQDPRSYEEIKRDAQNWRRDVLAVSYATASEAFGRRSGGGGPR